MKQVPPQSVASPWYLVQVRPNSFRIAERNLLRQDIDIFSPHHIETRRWGGRFRQVPAPLYPGYLFVTFDPDIGPWKKINSTYGVTRLVTFGSGYPKPLPRGLVEGLRLRCDPDGGLLPIEELAPGDRVQLLSGPFAEMICEVERQTPDERVVVLMDLMGRRTRMSVARQDVDRLSASHAGR